MGNIIEMHNNYNDHRWDYVYSILLKKYSKYGYVNIKTMMLQKKELICINGLASKENYIKKDY